MNLFKFAGLCTVVTSLVACGGGGGGGGGGSASSPQETKPFTGLWSGTAVSSVTGARIDVRGGATADGEVILYAPTECHVYAGSSVSGDGNIKITATAVSKEYCYGGRQIIRLGWIPSQNNSPMVTTLAASGTYSARATANLNYTTGVGDSGTIGLNFSQRSDRGSSLAKLQGTYKTGNRTFTVSSDGKLTSDSNPGGLTYSASISVIDPAVNLYRIVIQARDYFSYTYSGFAYLSDAAAGGTDNVLVMFGRELSGTSAFVLDGVK